MNFARLEKYDLRLDALEPPSDHLPTISHSCCTFFSQQAGIVTPDLGGKHSTQQVTDFIAKEAKSIVGL